MVCQHATVEFGICQSCGYDLAGDEHRLLIDKLLVQKDKLLTACKIAYRKHHLGHESIGWDELSDLLLNTLTEIMGDDEFCEWLEHFKKYATTNVTIDNSMMIRCPSCYKEYSIPMGKNVCPHCGY